MTRFTGPLEVTPLDWLQTSAAQKPQFVVDASGSATQQGLHVTGTTLVSGAITTHDTLVYNVATTAVVSAGGTGDAIPTSAAAYVEVNVGGTAYLLALFSKG